MYKFGEKILVIYEFANNFSGKSDILFKMIDKFYCISQPYIDLFDFAIKFQYRELETLIHKKYKNNYNYKYVKRFQETKTDWGDLKTAKNVNSNKGIITICTPFDEDALEKVVEHNFDIIKIASCSSTDWPLLNKIVEIEKPIIISTAGSTLEDLDKIVAFFEHRNKNFALMYCKGEYPTEPENMNLNQIDVLRNRYLNIIIGFSTHEKPSEIDSVKIAVAKGARIFEKHVAIQDFNSYSASPEEIKKWLEAIVDTLKRCGSSKREFSEKELLDLKGLKRGVFLKEDMKKDDKILRENVYYAIPNFDDQILANDMSKYIDITLKKDVSKDEPLYFKDVEYYNKRKKAYEILEKTKELLKQGNIHLPNKMDIHISHHYGIENFYKYGAVIIDVINREYCKKVIILLPNQIHPLHYHKIKEETFHILYGSMQLEMNCENNEYKAGDIIVVNRYVKHSFSTKIGVIFEELSTTHYKNDSFYSDDEITNNKFRKTEMTLREI